VRKYAIALWVLALAATFGGTTYVLFRSWNYFRNVPELWRSLPLIAWPVLAAATALFFFIDYLRLYYLLRILDVRLNVRRGLKAVFTSDFAGILTPTAELHVPAAILVLSQADIPVEKATAAITMKTSIGIVWVCAMSLVLLFAFGAIHAPRAVSGHLVYIVAPIGVVVLFYLSMLFFGSRIYRWTKRQESRRLSFIRKTFYRWLGNSSRDLSILGSIRAPHLYAHLLTIAYVLMYSFIG